MGSKEMATILIAFNIVGANKKNNNVGDVQDKIISCKTFFIDKLIGSFFSCIYDGKLRIHLVFNEDTSFFNDEIFALIQSSIEIAGINHGTIWFRRTTDKIVSYVGEKFILTPNSEEFLYFSTEYVMRRDKFDKTFDSSILEVKPYEEAHIDLYLELLSDAMSFFVPPEDFVSKKTNYLNEFSDFKNKNTFEAFWKDGKLIGLYWIVGTEVDTMGVSSDFQRFGYGSMILTRAIENVFNQNPEAEKALLYCVGWNAKAQNFYKAYGMEIDNQYEVPYKSVNPTL